MSSTSANTNHPSSVFRVNYSDYVADITGSPKTGRRSAATGIGHHINPLHNPYPNQQNQPKQQTGGMPQYGGSSDKCARCSKTVYIAEKKAGAGRSFHASCFNCYTCKRKLDSTGLSEHKGEIYCKTCYTKQFGAHGLISGVTMSTEQVPIHSSRRSSNGSDLGTPGNTNQLARQRTYSNDNVFRDQYDGKQNETSPIKRNSQQSNSYNTSPEKSSPLKKNNEGINAIIDTKYQRSPSPPGIDHRHRSTYMEEDDRSKYVYEGQKLSYGSGTSAIVDIPVAIHNKQSNSILNQFELPTESTRDYQRQNSREPKTDLTDDYSRLNINEDNNIRKYSYPSTHETKQQIPTSYPNDHSRESSPTNYRNQSPPPTTGYISSTNMRTTTSNTYQTGTPSSSTYIPQYNYRMSDVSTNSTHSDNRSPSPQSNAHISTGLTDFITKTNLAGNLPSSSSSNDNNKNATLGALVGSFRQSKSNDDDWVD